MTCSIWTCVCRGVRDPSVRLLMLFWFSRPNSRAQQCNVMLSAASPTLFNFCRALCTVQPVIIRILVYLLSLLRIRRHRAQRLLILDAQLFHVFHLLISLLPATPQRSLQARQLALSGWLPSFQPTTYNSKDRLPSSSPQTHLRPPLFPHGCAASVAAALC
jgi:hypothetical protein